MTASPPSRTLRLARLLRPAGNPLARGTDRAEAAVVVLSVLLAMVLVPVMLTLGSVTYSNLVEQSARQSRGRHETVAVLTQDAPGTSVGTRGETVSGKAKVPARWRLPDGTTRTGLVEADDGSKAGAEVSVWLDQSGRPARPPMSTVDFVGAGVLVALFGWLTTVGLLALGCWGLHRVLDRRRYRDWDAEWTRIEPDWHDQSR
ncbi:hypothetical protein [Actinophytocola sp.]|uniref:Rv1733c family protein n=1 Tax=Actinophytocola sp. TaxID=1872138 RepID=UPI002D37B7A6|nr:hypothetical protein [Actinophytocola sp.]HYQ63983.1 hypothetical protein [Actinophytocola sp.]